MYMCTYIINVYIYKERVKLFIELQIINERYKELNS